MHNHMGDGSESNCREGNAGRAQPHTATQPNSRAAPANTNMALARTCHTVAVASIAADGADVPAMPAGNHAHG